MLTFTDTRSPTAGGATTRDAARDRCRYHSCADATNGERSATSAARNSASPRTSRRRKASGWRLVERTKGARDAKARAGEFRAEPSPWPLTSMTVVEEELKDELKAMSAYSDSGVSAAQKPVAPIPVTTSPTAIAVRGTLPHGVAGTSTSAESDF